MPESPTAALLTNRDDLDPGGYDVVVIGGGVNGLAVAREAAMSGLSVLLLERDDIGGQTSSISTRLIHGGLKYLERLDMSLVFESIREQRRLLRDAPHLVHSYPMLIPFYRNNTRPGWLLSCGLAVYKLLTGGKLRTRLVGPRRLAREWPSIDKNGLRRGAIFDDAQVPWTERLCVELAVSAQAHGGHILTRADVHEVIVEGRVATAVRFSGPRGSRTARARVVVNAAGPWVDDVLATTGVVSPRPTAEPLVGPTKGSHLVVDPFPGAPATCVFFEARADGRPVFVLPWAGRYMVGSTDLPYTGSLDLITADDGEIDYLLDETNQLIPEARLDRASVLWSYSGVRPLPYVSGMTDPATVTRGHLVVPQSKGIANVVTVIGGKFTTHRALGEDVVASVFASLGRTPVPSPTHDAPFPGAPVRAGYASVAEMTSALQAEWGGRLGENVVQRLAALYGSRAHQVAALVETDPHLAQTVDPDSGAIAAEVAFAVTCEGAVSLEDILLRRILVGLNGDVGISAAPAVADVTALYLGWDEDTKADEINAYLAATKRFQPRASEWRDD
ncbi:glycerol-3-phosphate dehydrogenase/oxidase [Mycobacterium sp. 236(2023)]|uniref:glycerol-3-phosphate dehydrogenase/oxidase n=1 Tax=Mycobacterium sp. 236(2023) TaxID=3038163 RepID=UPI002414F0BC|nr:glycerol-3-phosphate dehydrogenase/oxidase [Mycobacterium sp. 236(2023)]MDG4667121.1 glycerol-3-phosphate dehydrogenase/oxidase [Mycobacterium sp. 236(2023)]